MRQTRDNMCEWSSFLDNNQMDMLIVKYLISENGKEVIEFVAIYTTIIGESPKEVVKYDFSKKETLHSHHNYQKNQKKVFINKEVSIETIMEIVEYVEKNWRKMKMQFMER